MDVNEDDVICQGVKIILNKIDTLRCRSRLSLLGKLQGVCLGCHWEKRPCVKSSLSCL